jgi:hypothetical protein
MNLQFKTVIEAIVSLEMNFNLEAKESYDRMIFKFLTAQGVTDDSFSKATLDIMAKYDKLFALPPVAMWLKHCNSGGLEIEEVARKEVVKMVGIFIPYFSGGVIFDNPTTNAAMEVYGGLKKLKWALDPDNKNKPDFSFLKRDLKDIWLGCYDEGKEAYEPQFDSTSNKEIRYEGDKERCLALIKKGQMLIEEEKKDNPMKGVVKNLANYFKV